MMFSSRRRDKQNSGNAGNIGRNERKHSMSGFLDMAKQALASFSLRETNGNDASKRHTAKLYANKYDARSMRARTLQGVVNNSRKRASIASDTERIAELCSRFTDAAVEKIDKTIEAVADQGKFKASIALTYYRWPEESASRFWEGCFTDTLYIDINDSAGAHEFANSDQAWAYADKLHCIICAYYKQMGYSVATSGWEKFADDSKKKHYSSDRRMCISISWHDDETSRLWDKVDNETEVEAYARGIGLRDILIGKV